MVGSWWSRTGPVKRVAIVALAGVVGLNAMLVVLDSVVGSDPGGATGSSFATQEEGVAGWADLLRLRDVPVTSLQVPLDEAELDAASTLVIVDPDDEPSEAELRALVDFVNRGGNVVAVGRGAVPHMVVALGQDPQWRPGGPTDPAPLDGVESLGSVRELSADGRGSFRPTPPLEEVVGGDNIVTAVRRGRVTAVADPSLFWNDRLAEDDNAAFALALSGDGPVVFAEAGHGYGASQGVAALPVEWRLAAAGLVVATLLAMWCAGQRFGPPERTVRVLPPPRAAYVEAMAGALTHAPAPRMGSPPTGAPARPMSDPPPGRPA